MDGVLNLLKPSGPTSHDMVDEVRRVLGVRKVGHAGTLDPMASGVLVVCVGKAVKVSEFLMASTKTYVAGIRFGVSTDTQDITGQVLEDVDASWVTESDLAGGAARFVGDIQQEPPMVSAVKHQGQRLYKLARAGVTVERKPRDVRIHSIHVKSFVPGSHPEGVIEVVCSSGTYIRTLCADIGAAIGSSRSAGLPACMSSLVRTAVGRFEIGSSVSVEKLRAESEGGRAIGLLVPIAEALSGLPRMGLSAADMELVVHGRLVALGPDIDGTEKSQPGDTLLLTDSSGTAVAVGKVVISGDVCAVAPDKVLV